MNSKSIMLLACTSLLGGTAVAKQSTEAKRPNVIFILTDDQRFDALGAMGNDIIQTPNLDRLANDGILFTNAYVPSPISCCSRSSLLTGQYSIRNGVYDFFTPIEGEALENTYPLLMRQSGYNIGFIGKYGVGNPNTLPKDKYDFWACENKHQPNYENKDEYGNYMHHSDQVNREIQLCLDNFAAEDKPFCLSVSFKAPHSQDGDPNPFIIHPRYESYYQDVTIPDAPVGDDKYWMQFPEAFRKNNEARSRWEVRFSTPELYQKSVKNYYRLITQADDVVGDMLHQLERLGLDENTIIVFMGDNGFYLGEHGMAGKWYLHEESVRVPMFIYNPQAKRSERGKKVDKMVLNIDLTSTILGFAGVEQPASMQGCNLYNTLDKHYPWRTEFFFEHRLPGPTVPKSEGVVGERYKYACFYELKPQYEMLFDLKNDPHEVNNLATDPAYADLLAEMRAKTQQLKQQAK